MTLTKEEKLILTRIFSKLTLLCRQPWRINIQRKRLEFCCAFFALSRHAQVYRVSLNTWNANAFRNKTLRYCRRRCDKTDEGTIENCRVLPLALNNNAFHLHRVNKISIWKEYNICQYTGKSIPSSRKNWNRRRTLLNTIVFDVLSYLDDKSPLKFKHSIHIKRFFNKGQGNRKRDVGAVERGNHG